MKRNQENKLDRLFREGLEEGRVAPPPHLWRNIAEASPGGKRRRGGFILWATIAAAAFATFLVWNFYPANTGVGSEGNTNFTEGNSNRNKLPKEAIPMKKENLGENQSASANMQPGTPQEAIEKNAIAKENQQARPVIRSNNKRVSPQLFISQENNKIAPDNANIIVEENDFAHADNQKPEGDFGTGDKSPEKIRKAPRPVKDLLHMTPDSPKEQIVKEETAPAFEGINRDLPTNLPTQGTGGESRWLIAGNFGPDLQVGGFNPNSINMSDGGVGLGTAQPQNLNNEVYTQTSTAYSTGVRVGYALSERFQVQSGANYASQRGTTYDPRASGGFLQGDGARGKELALNMIEIPILGRYDVISGSKVRYFVSSGVSTQWIINYAVSDGAELSAGSTQVEGNRSSPEQVNALLGTGLEFLPTDLIGIQIEPLLRYGTQRREYLHYSGRPVSLTLNTGINFRF